jgi:hypothetical protein
LLTLLFLPAAYTLAIRENKPQARLAMNNAVEEKENLS